MINKCNLRKFCEKHQIPLLTVIIMVVLITVAALALFPGATTKQADIVTYEARNANYISGGNDISQGMLREEAISLISIADGRSKEYRNNYAKIKDYGDGYGYTAGIIGFSSRRGDILKVVDQYIKLKPDDNIMTQYRDALEEVKGTYSHQRLGTYFEAAWIKACTDDEMIQAQNMVLDNEYIYPSLNLAKKDGLSNLGQYIYFDAIVTLGTNNNDSFFDIRDKAISQIKTPSNKGSEKNYLNRFLSIYEKTLSDKALNTSRVKLQKDLLDSGNYKMQLPLNIVYDDITFNIKKENFTEK